MKPLIGITTGEVVNIEEPWESTVYGQKHRYSDAVIAAGGVPVLIPFMPEAELKELYSRLDGVLFSGGNDISPQLYGEEKHPLTIDVSDERDRVECLLLMWALSDNKPLFAICRGFQLFNVLLGGSLYQDISSDLSDSLDHQLSTLERDTTFIAHELKLEPTSKLANITNTLRLNANTHHHQGIKRLSPELRATAWAEDGIIEGIEHPGKKFALGVQCHPESLYGTDQKWAAVFREFIKSVDTENTLKSTATLHYNLGHTNNI